MKNKGFTLIELIVVISIMGILAIAIEASVSASGLSKVKHCVTKTDNLIEKCRIGALSRSGNVRLVIRADGSGKIIADYYESGSSPVSSDVLSESGISMTYTIENSDKTNQATHNVEDRPLTLSFNRSTGSQKPDENGYLYTAIVISSGSTSREIKLVPLTGAHVLS